MLDFTFWTFERQDNLVIFDWMCHVSCYLLLVNQRITSGNYDVQQNTTKRV